MIIHGGLIHSNHVIDKFLCLDIATSKWSDVKKVQNNLGRLAGHTFALVLHSERKLYQKLISMYNLPKLSNNILNK